jgi:hypothetical protein
MMRTRLQALALLMADARAAGLDTSRLATDDVLCEDGCTVMIYAGDQLARCYDLRPKLRLVKAAKAKKLGTVKKQLLIDLAKFVMLSPILTDEEKEAFLAAAGDWV